MSEQVPGSDFVDKTGEIYKYLPASELITALCSAWKLAGKCEAESTRYRLRMQNAQNDLRLAENKIKRLEKKIAENKP
jgi:hypothetical protein